MRAILASLLLVSSAATAQDAGPKVTPLVNSKITGVEGHNAIMSRVEIPANVALPMHCHATEEFLYVIEGRAILRIEGAEDRWLEAGMAAVIPAGAVHTGVTGDAPAVALTTYIHPEGAPIRQPAAECKE